MFNAVNCRTLPLYSLYIFMSASIQSNKWSPCHTSHGESQRRRSTRAALKRQFQKALVFFFPRRYKQMTSQGGPRCIELGWATLSGSPLVCQTDGGSNIMRAGNKLQDFEQKILWGRARGPLTDCHSESRHKSISPHIKAHRIVPIRVPSQGACLKMFLNPLFFQSRRKKKPKTVTASPRHLESPCSSDVWQGQPAFWLIRSRNLVMCAHPH